MMLLFIIPSCKNNSDKSVTPDMKTTFIHTVFFWLNDTVTEEEKIEFECSLEKLVTVPGIISFYYGKPAGTPRDVVNNSYDYVWIVHFSDAAYHNIYQAHPVHL